jgi:acyl-CoA thioesterase-1
LLEVKLFMDGAKDREPFVTALPSWLLSGIYHNYRGRRRRELNMISSGRSFLFAGLLFAVVLGVTDTANAQVVALGASNVAGRGVSSSEAFPAQLERMLSAKGYSVNVTNAGISGDTNEGMLAWLDSAVPDGTKVVILDTSGGTFNARRKNLGDQTAQLASISARLRARGIKVIPSRTGHDLGLGSEYRQVDGLHLTPAGHTRVAAQLLPAVIQSLRH